MSLFIRGESIDLHALSGNEPETLAARPWLHDEPARGERVLLGVLRPPGRRLGVVGLSDIDWLARRARLVGWWSSNADATAGEAAEAVARIVAYARDELNLDALDASGADEVGERALAAAGFAAGRWARFQESAQ